MRPVKQVGRHKSGHYLARLNRDRQTAQCDERTATRPPKGPLGGPCKRPVMGTTTAVSTLWADTCPTSAPCG